MKTRRFYVSKPGTLEEDIWDKPEPAEGEIEVKALYTGLCRSDIDMYAGKFTLLPRDIQGHEGLGQVTKVCGSNHTCKVGDFVATRGEPAFSDFYNVRNLEYVVVPDCHPKYILEPVACGINIAEKVTRNGDILLIGTGFLAKVVYNHLRCYNTVTVLGNHSLDYWKKQNVVMVNKLSDVKNKYDVIIDLSSNDDVFNADIFNPGADYIMASPKMCVVTDFSKHLWNATTIIMPSPRNNTFHDCMLTALDFVEKHPKLVDNLWTQEIDRELLDKRYFDAGSNRTTTYSRSYVKWKQWKQYE